MTERTQELSPVTDVAPAPVATEAPAVRAPLAGAVKVRGADGRVDAGRLRWIAAVVGGVMATPLFLYLWHGRGWPLLAALGGGVGLAAALDLALLLPVELFLRRMASEAARLRAALACPYCRATIEDDGALACDRPGCGALYHEGCWEECRGSYGGCAIYGCGCKTAHGVGWFALQRRVWRTLVAAVLFTPKVVQRLQAAERATLREEWRRARQVQLEISTSAQTLLVGLVNVTVCIGAAGLLSILALEGRIPVEAFALGSIALIVASVLFMRAPLVGVFAWGVLRVVARLFRDELALLQRADAGTFLARLAGGAGKKG